MLHNNYRLTQFTFMCMSLIREAIKPSNTVDLRALWAYRFFNAVRGSIFLLGRGNLLNLCVIYLMRISLFTCFVFFRNNDIDSQSFPLLLHEVNFK